MRIELKHAIIVSVVLGFFIVTLFLLASYIRTSSGKPVYIKQDVLYNGLSKHAKLPPGETPNISYVKDLSKVSHPEFFKNAKVGDVVILFRSSQMVYLYRESTGQLINYKKVNTYDNTSIPNPDPSPSPTPFSNTSQK